MPVIPEREATHEIRHHHDRGHEQDGGEGDAEEDGQLGEGTTAGTTEREGECPTGRVRRSRWLRTRNDWDASAWGFP
jgi:hypothetical protein